MCVPGVLLIFTHYTVLFHYHILKDSLSRHIFLYLHERIRFIIFFFHIFSSFYPLTPFSYNFYKKLHIITLLSLLFFTVFVLLFFYLIVIFPPPAPYFKYRPYIYKYRKIHFYKSSSSTTSFVLLLLLVVVIEASISSAFILACLSLFNSCFNFSIISFVAALNMSPPRPSNVPLLP